MNPTTRLYAVLLRLMPRRFRRIYGDEMQRLLQLMRRNQYRRTLGGRLRFGLRALWDVVLNAILEYMSAVRLRTSRRRSTYYGKRAPVMMSRVNPWQDVRHAMRTFIRAPGFAFISVTTLAVGIGANIAVFNAVQAVLLEPLPYHESDRLVRLYERRPHQDRMRNPLSLPDYVDWRAAKVPALTGMAVFTYGGANLTGVGSPIALSGARVSEDYFELLGVSPMLGRTFAAEESRPGAEPLVILSHGTWQRVFGADHQLVGSGVSLDGVTHVVVGVMPRGFSYPFNLDYWVPLTANPAESSRGGHGYHGIARLAPNASVDDAFGQLNAVAQRLAEEYPETNEQHLANVEALKDVEVGNTSFILWFLFAAVGLVLVLVVTNIAGMQLARGISRQRELAVRTSLGASRGRLIKQLLTESIVLALVGSAAGLLVAVGLSGWLTPRIVEAAPWITQTGVDWRPVVFGVTAAVVLCATLGMIPALSCSRIAFAHILREGSRSSQGLGKTRLRNTLVVAEVALALLLLIGAGLVARSLSSLLGVDPGFDESGVLSVELVLPASRYEEGIRIVEFFDEVEAQLRAVPGVEGVGYTWLLPFSGSDAGRNFSIEGREPPSAGDSWNARIRIADAEYFQTMRIPLKTGRLFEPTDRWDGAGVAVVNETMAQMYWPDGDAMGARFRLGSSGPWTTIVGVIGDVRHANLETDPTPEFYMYRRQMVPPYGVIVARSETDVAGLMATTRSIVASIDPELPINSMALMEERIERTVSERRLAAGVVGSFGLVGLILAAVGVYGVISYTVGQRAHEVGVRMALGGRSADVLSLFLREGMRIVGLGLVLGLGTAIAVSRFLSSFLYGISPTDVVSYVGAGAILALIALAAVFLPAVRASRVDPVVTLKTE